LARVAAILRVLVAIGWRWIDRPAVLAASIVAGGVTKLQPLALAGWALLTGRIRAAVYVVGAFAVLAVASVAILGPSTVGAYVGLLARVSAPVTTPHNFTPGAIAFQAGAPEAVASAIQLAAVAFAV